MLVLSTGYLCSRGRSAAARTASAVVVPADTPATSSNFAWVSALGDGMPCHSQRTVCSSRTGLIGGNHPASVGDLYAEDKSDTTTANAAADKLSLLGQFCEQRVGQF